MKIVKNTGKICKIFGKVLKNVENVTRKFREKFKET